MNSEKLQRRRTDSKSRYGCYSCKASKTKCSETKPTCNNCLKRCIYCRYPKRPLTLALADIPAPRPLWPTFPTASMTQGQNFSHYLSVAYPSLPAGNEDIWRTYIPQYAIRNEDLMAAVLGLSAAHFRSLHGLHNYYAAASTYRTQALAGLQRIMSKKEWNRNEADAVVAISYLLGFQSRLMVAGLFDFFTMLRGTTLLSEHVITKTSGSSFRLSRQAISPSLNATALLNLPDLDPHLIRKGLISHRSLKPILASAEHVQFFNALQGVFEACLVSTVRGLIEYWKFLDSATSNLFTSDDMVTALLKSFLVALKLLMEPIVQHLHNDRQKDRVEREAQRVTVRSGEDIFQDLTPQLNRYAELPKAVIASREI